MLGLNLNTNIPFSPDTGVTYNASNVEEEVDAVTGMMDVASVAFRFFYGRIRSFMCISSSNKR